MQSGRFVVLDRDGVINEDSDEYIKSPSEWEAIPGSISAIAKLSHVGFRIAVVTNQSGIARGFFDQLVLNAIHQKLREQVVAGGGRLEMILFCPHGPGDDCECRKPRGGLLVQLAARTGIDLRGVPLVGDSISDIRAARFSGMQPLLVKTGKGGRTLSRYDSELKGVAVFPNLKVIADHLVSIQGDS